MRKSTRPYSLALSFLCAIGALADVPFKTSTLTDGEFDIGTTWYTMQIGASGYYLSDNDGADYIALSATTSTLADADLWCFVGDEENGYKIYNKQAGAGMVLAASTTMESLSGYSGTGGTTYPTLQDTANIPEGYIDAWDFEDSDKIEDLENGQFMLLHGTSYAVNNFGNIGKLAFWVEGAGAGSTLNIGFAETTLEINEDNGEWTSSNSSGTWHSAWSSNDLDGFTFTASANNMVYENGYIIGYSGTAQTSTYTISAPTGYIVYAYEFDFVNGASTTSTLTLTFDDATYTSSSEEQHVAADSLEEQTVQFVQSGANQGLVFKNFYVTFRASTAETEEEAEIFTYASSSDVAYRIPAIAQANNGDLIAVADYRYSGSDIGVVTNGKIDLRGRISHDQGETWGDIFTIATALGSSSPDSLHVAFGDPCIVADRESSRVLLMSCSGNVSFPNGTRTNHQGIARFYSEDNGATWTDADDIVDISESIYGQFDSCAIGTARSMFIGSGRICQSYTTKVGDYYRLYCAVLYKDVNAVNKNYVLYSDDFGESWSVLGGVNVAPIPSGADEPKVEELPDGSILVSSRITGGRYYNIFTFTDSDSAQGSWSTMATSNSSNNGVSALSNSCNGEVMCVPVVRNSDNAEMYLMLQSVPFGSGRANVGIYYKELESLADFIAPDSIAKDWDGRHKATSLGSAYSTMAWQHNNSLGFLYEEETYGLCYTIIYKNYSIETITDSLYSYNEKADRNAFVAAGIDVKTANVAGYVGTNVGNISEESYAEIQDVINAYTENPTKTAYEAINAAVDGAEQVELTEGVMYRLRNKLWDTDYLVFGESALSCAELDEEDETQLVIFLAGDEEGYWKVGCEATGTYLGTTPAIYNALTLVTADEAVDYNVVSALNGESYLACVSPTNSSYPALHDDNAYSRLVPWTTSASASRWYIEPTDLTAMDIEAMVIADNAERTEAVEEVYYDLSGRAVPNPAKGIYVTDRNRKIMLK